ncbi:hypothetical protein F5Y06DRAFT_212657 [Hypoxylon sp. FL0890]|nr:hypothetical protein F5Y06DRAFT_212657 [Hypoxylon sp. FL0890]
MASFRHQPSSGLAGRPPLIESLPVELILAIMEQLPDIKSLTNFAKASPRARSVFNANQVFILKQILRRQLGRLLPIAVARLEASRAKWAPKRPLQLTEPSAGYGRKLIGFCRRYLAGQATELCVPNRYFTLEKARELWSFHNNCVSRWIDDLADRMRGEPFGLNLHTPYHRRLTDIEMYRIGKTLYVTELASILLPIRYGSVLPGQRDILWESFWQHFPPWEYCQYAEMQLVLIEFCNNTLWRREFHKIAPMGFMLRQIPQSLRESRGRDLGHISEVLAFQAGLDVLKDVSPYLRRPTAFKFSDATEHICENPGILHPYRSRYFQPWCEHWRHLIAATHKNLWLAEMDTEDGSVVYTIDLDQLKKKYMDSDDAPLSCWLLDLLNFENHASIKYRIRGRPERFFLSSFWSKQRWDSQYKKLRPHISSLKPAAAACVLAENNEVILKPNNLRPHVEEEDEVLEDPGGEEPESYWWPYLKGF